MRREDVEALRARVLREADNAAERGVRLTDMTFSVEGDTLDALCRAWLAVQEAPAGKYEYIVSDVAYIHFDNEGDAPRWSEDRVRIVKEPSND